NATQRDRRLDGLKKELPRLRVEAARLRLVLLARGGQKCGQLLALEVLAYQVAEGEDLAAHLPVHEPAQGLAAALADLRQRLAQLFAARAQVFDQKRLALDARHDARHDEVDERAEDAGDDDGVERDHQQRREQPPRRPAAVKQQGESGDDAQVDVHQHPVAERAGAPAVDLLPERVAHHGGDADEADDARYPANRQPGAAEARVYAEALEAPDD